MRLRKDVLGIQIKEMQREDRKIDKGGGRTDRTQVTPDIDPPSSASDV